MRLVFPCLHHDSGLAAKKAISFFTDIISCSTWLSSYAYSLFCQPFPILPWQTRKIPGVMHHPWSSIFQLQARWKKAMLILPLIKLVFTQKMSQLRHITITWAWKQIQACQKMCSLVYRCNATSAWHFPWSRLPGSLLSHPRMISYTTWNLSGE